MARGSNQAFPICRGQGVCNVVTFQKSRGQELTWGAKVPPKCPPDCVLVCAEYDYSV